MHQRSCFTDDCIQKAHRISVSKITKNKGKEQMNEIMRKT